MWHIAGGRVEITECFGVGACFYRGYPVPTGVWSASRGMVSSQVHTDGHDVEWRLVALDGIPVVDSGRTSRIQSRPASAGSLSELCRAHPEVVIRWSTVDGRLGIVPAGDFQRLLGRSPRQVLRVEALFPEGAWTGNVLPR